MGVDCRGRAECRWEATEKGPHLPAGGSHSPNLRREVECLASEEFWTQVGYDTFLMSIPPHPREVPSMCGEAVEGLILSRCMCLLMK
jgi:hypothetical protein